MNYLSSSEALTTMCEIRPPRYIREGLKYLGVATLCGAVGLGAGIGSFYFAGYIPDYGLPSSTKFDFIKLKHLYYATGAAIFSIGMLAGTLALANGVTSLINRWLPHRYGSVYYTKGGYTKTVSIFDKLPFFGRRVHPVDSPAELLEYDQVFVNGVTLKNRTFIKEEAGDEVIVTPDETLKLSGLVDCAYVGFQFGEEEIQSYTKDPHLIEILAQKPEGSTLYLRAEPSFGRSRRKLSEIEFELEEVGAAL